MLDIPGKLTLIEDKSVIITRRKFEPSVYASRHMCQGYYSWGAILTVQIFTIILLKLLGFSSSRVGLKKRKESKKHESLRSNDWESSLWFTRSLTLCDETGGVKGWGLPFDISGLE
ncbi:hypothetical protein KQX54_019336 [Cotesia glomerata]|uniref:Transmembrane protein n=1 Tax=Cotesia glomerata TaxID=32391 RepID=A0AAV7IZC1_COTGL|nr:hypothetical protein KQX54_019336 [Cotesia glomerata]